VIHKTPILLALLTLLFTSFLHGCHLTRSAGPISGATLKEWKTGLDRIANHSHQLLLVLNQDPPATEAMVYAFEKTSAQWDLAFSPVRAVIGRKGFAALEMKQEGDGKTPSGVFRLGTAFGYAGSVQTRMPYRQVTEDDIWVDDKTSKDYNRWVKRGTTAARSYEALRRSDDLYKYGIIIEYNMNPVIQGMGSAIFIHLWRGEGIPTEGCVALSEKDMVRILEWLDPALKPVIAMGTQSTLEGFVK
jgi:L,D-peptidoglycan transpeptidase YkuD (ErfK/YbiS/YcfS/YnhG family)